MGQIMMAVAVTQRCSVKKAVWCLQLCQGTTPSYVFFCELCQSFQNSFYRTPKSQNVFFFLIWNLHYLLLSTANAMSNMIIDFCFCTRLLIVYHANRFPDNCIWLCWRKTGYLYDWNPGIISLKHLSNTSLCKLLAILHMEAVIRSCSVEKAFLKISHNLQKKFQSFCFNTVTKRKTLTQVFSCSFPVSFAKFLKLFFTENPR